MKHNSLAIKFLASIGVGCVWANDNYAFFNPPYTSQANFPCLMVDLTGNHWADTSDTTLHGDAADLVALAMSTTREIAEDILLSLQEDANATVFPPIANDAHYNPQETTIITRNMVLTSPSLIDMLERRKLDVAAVRRHCREIAFCNPQRGTSDYGIAFENLSGGYTYITNRGAVRCLLRQDIAVIREPEPLGDECLLFVSPLCYLSFLSKNGEPRLNVYLAFTSTNILKLLPRISGEKKVIFYSPNTDAKIHMLPLLRKAGLLVEDMSVWYRQYKNYFLWYLGHNQ